MYFSLFFITEKAELKDQEKWDNTVRDIEKNLKRDDFSAVLKLVDQYLSVCKSPELRLHALMTKVDSCFEAWKQTSKSKSNDVFSQDITVGKLGRQLYACWCSKSVFWDQNSFLFLFSILSNDSPSTSNAIKNAVLGE